MKAGRESLFNHDDGCSALFRKIGNYHTIRHHSNLIEDIIQNIKTYTKFTPWLRNGRQRNRRGSIPGRSKKFIFSFQASSGAELTSTQPTQWSLSSRKKQAGREADHSPPSSVEIKNGGAIRPLPPYVYKMQCLIKHWNSYTFKCLANIYCDNVK
jgi:hypothetical protein